MTSLPQRNGHGAGVEQVEKWQSRSSRMKVIEKGGKMLFRALQNFLCGAISALLLQHQQQTCSRDALHFHILRRITDV